MGIKILIFSLIMCTACSHNCNTVLEYKVVNNVKVDSCVVFKNKE